MPRFQIADDRRAAASQISVVTIACPIDTARLTLRPWQADDAPELAPILEANVAHLGPWIPPAISTPAPVDKLRERLSGFAREFAADVKWRFAIVARDDESLLGEVDLFPRNASGRVSYPDADRAEIGYWLRADRTGEGLALEAAAAMVHVASRLSAFSQLEIRCDAANAPSAAIPAKLGFELMETIPDGDAMLQVWVKPIAGRR